MTPSHPGERTSQSRLPLPGRTTPVRRDLAKPSTVPRASRPTGTGLLSPRPEPEQRVAEFAELAAAAIASAETQAQLIESRARVVASADETRRRIERDLHDGARQRLLSIALRLRMVQAAVPRELRELGSELKRAIAGLRSVLDELCEYVRGIHPAFLAEHGLGPALKALTRSCPIAVNVDVRVEGRLPEQIEVTISASR
jgi:signal transduction histidine kinase